MWLGCGLGRSFQPQDTEKIGSGIVGGGAKQGKQQQTVTFVPKFLRKPCTQVTTPDGLAPDAWIPRNRPLLAFLPQFRFPGLDSVLGGLQPLSSGPGPTPGPAPPLAPPLPALGPAPASGSTLALSTPCLVQLGPRWRK